MPHKYPLPALLVFSLAFFCANGQARTQFLGIEAGFSYLGAIYSENSNIRQNDDKEGYDPMPPAPFESYGMTGRVYRFFIGEKFEMRSSNERWGISTGLRFNVLSTFLVRNSTPSYYYFLFDQTGTTTNYLRIREVNQRTGYLGVPLELKYFPARLGRARFYLMIGGDFNYQLFTTTDVKFENPVMAKYEDSVGRIVGDPKASFGSFYAGLGWAFGKEGKPVFTVGLTFPVVMTNSISNLMTPDVGGGLHLQFQFPLKKVQ